MSSEPTVPISETDLDELRQALKPLVGQSFKMLSLPKVALKAVEPSQIGTIVGALMDAMIPHLTEIDLPTVGLQKHAGTLGEREGYPDYLHSSGRRLELKLLYIDNLPARSVPAGGWGPWNSNSCTSTIPTSTQNAPLLRESLAPD